MANKNKKNKTAAQKVQSAVDSAVARLVSNGSGGGTRRRGNRRSGNGQVGMAVGSNTVSGNPTFNGTGNVVVSNTEFIVDVRTTFASPLTYDVNPGSVTTFPWLSRVAQNFELFRFRRLEFHYSPACPTTTQGTLVMAFDYDASDAPPATKQQILAYAGANRSNLWSRATVALKCPSSWSYVGNLNGPINPSNTDIKLYDVAKTYIGTYNIVTPDVMVGEISVSYTVELAKPNWEIPITGSAYVTISGSNKTNLFGTSMPLYGDLPIKTYNNNVVGVNQQGLVEFPKSGSYVLEVKFSFASTTSPPSLFGASGLLRVEQASERPEFDTDYPDAVVLDAGWGYAGSDVTSWCYVSLYVDTTSGNWIRFMTGSFVATAVALYSMRFMSYKKILN